MADEYVLGTNQKELDRLHLQQHVWGSVTSAFLDRIGIREGWRCLDAGCGPGFTLEPIRERCGESGSLLALDESPIWMDHLKGLFARKKWKNVSSLQAKAEDAKFEANSFDLIFVRWVLSFPPDVPEILKVLSAALKPGGFLAIQDYNHEGISVFPESAGFKAVVAGTRKYYASRGGDPWISGKLPGMLRGAGLDLVANKCNVLCGGPGSGVWDWADAFFPPHSERMVEVGAMSESDRKIFLREWQERAGNPDALFFSPIVVDSLARKRREAAR